MKKTLQMLIVFAFLFVGWNNQANAQTCQWAKQSSQGYIWEQDWSGFQSGTLIFTTDANNNAIVAGGFVSDTFKLDTVILTRKEYGCTFFIAKYDENGNLLWARQAYHSMLAVGPPRSICTDHNGNIFVVGEYGESGQDTVIFGPDTLIGGRSFLVKYDPNGNVLFAKSFGDQNLLGGTAMSFTCVNADPSGNVFVSGYFICHSIIFGSDTLNNYSDSLYQIFAGTIMADGFLVKFNGTTGAEIWAKKIGDNYSESVTCNATDPNGNVIITGVFTSDSLQIGSNTLYNTANDSGRFSNIFLAKIDGSTGNALWAKNYNTAILQVSYSELGPPDITTDIYGNIYMNGGYGSGTFLLDTITVSGNFLAKFNGNGNVQWAKNNLTGSISSDNSGNLYLLGYYQYSVVLNSMTLHDTSWRYYIAKFDGNGGLISAENIGSSGQVIGTGGTDGLIKAGINNDVFVSYSFDYDSLFMPPFSLTNPYNIAADGNDTAIFFIAKFTGFSNGIPNIFSDENIIIVYPNPATTLLNIHHSTCTSPETLLITDLLGTEVYKEILTGIDNTISISTWSAGIYFYEVRSNTDIARGKFVKEL